MSDDPREALTLWAWMVREADGSVGQIVVFDEAMGYNVGNGLTLTHRNRSVIDKMKPLALAHAKSSGRPVFLREYHFYRDHNDEPG